MIASDDLYQEIESYLSFLIDHELEDAYESQPLNRTLSENKSTFARAVTAGAPKPTHNPVNAAPKSHAPVPLRPAAPAHPDHGTLAREAQQRAAAARNLDELYAELEAFTAMPLRHEGAKKLVRACGAETPELLVIGEVPDADEDATGSAFAGKPGQMMDQALKAAGLADKAMLAPCVVWRPAGGRPLTPEDIDLNAPFLHALIRLSAPKAILLLGASAVTCVLRLDQNLGKLRGRPVRYTEGGHDLPAVASYPPAFLMRQPQAKAMLWRDLLSLAALIAP